MGTTNRPKGQNIMKKNDHIKKLILEQLRKLPIIEATCQKLEISRMTFYRLKKKDQKFAKEVVAAIEEGYLLINDLAENQLIGEVKERNLQAVIYWLRSHHRLYKPKEFQAGFAIAQDEDQNMFFEFFGKLKPENQKLIEPYLETLNKNTHDKHKPKS